VKCIIEDTLRTRTHQDALLGSPSPPMTVVLVVYSKWSEDTRASRETPKQHK
jgi:hypothetical protein